MLAASHAKFVCLFKELELDLEDTRDDNKVLYPLNEILFLVLAAVLSGAESWKAIVTYGEKKIDFLKKFFQFKNGTAGKTTILTIMQCMDKKKFESWLTQWAATLSKNISGELIAIDGKALKGARKGQEKNPLYLLNAFATKRGLVIGQMTINEKTNEIKAIPEMLDKLDIENAVISVDAIGCQKKIAEKIIEKKADYFLVEKHEKHLCY
jgi:hypothetical protein